MSVITESGVAPSSSASARSVSRWRSTGRAISRTSSGVENSRPRIAESAFEQSDSAPRAGAIMHCRMIARAAYDVHYIALYPRLDLHILYLGATTRNRIDFAERLNVNAIEASSVEAGIPARHDL